MLTRVGQEDRSAQGFTLIELIIAIGILGIVFSALSLAMLASMRANQETRVRLDETRDEQFVAAYFASDVNGATGMASGTTARCGTGTAIAELRGASFDSATPPNATVTVASYVFTTSTVAGVATGTLTRYACEAVAGAASYPLTPVSTTVVARTLAATSPVVVCSTGASAATCSAATTAMSVTFQHRSGGDPFVLSGSERTATP
jgi:prepilin-type N-terminal cleavage/methylation domain-containing protein